MMSEKPTSMLTARITHLEMNSRPLKSVPVPSRPRLAMLHAETMPLHFYRYLYERVGREYHWFERRNISDKKLAKIIHDENTIINVLYADGCPAGFVEISRESLPADVDIIYFGLMAEFRGKGIGKWFLHSAIQLAWDQAPARVTVCTNSLDHPAALGLYQKMGFSPYAVSEENIPAWES